MNKSLSIEDILQKLKDRAEENPEYFILTKGEEFEEVISTLLHKISDNQKLFTYVYNGTHAFPDFSISIDNKEVYGIEVKFSNSGNWNSNGNSVFETISEKDTDGQSYYTEIYVIFGRKPKKREHKEKLELRFDKYENAISNIAVTHSPRYDLNMNRSEEISVFSVINLPYKEFRLLSVEEKNSYIRDFLRQKSGMDNKWYLPLDLVEDSEEVKPQLLEKLDSAYRNRLLAESFILFMHDFFSGTTADYTGVVDYLVTHHFVVSASLRDKFSASGKVLLDGFDKDTEYPRILKNYQKQLPLIKKIISNPEGEFETLCLSIWHQTDRFSELIDEEKTLEENYYKIIEEFHFSVSVKVNGEELVTESRPYLSNIFKN